MALLADVVEKVRTCQEPPAAQRLQSLQDTAPRLSAVALQDAICQQLDTWGDLPVGHPLRCARTHFMGLVSDISTVKKMSATRRFTYWNKPTEVKSREEADKGLKQLLNHCLPKLRGFATRKGCEFALVVSKFGGGGTLMSESDGVRGFHVMTGTATAFPAIQRLREQLARLEAVENMNPPHFGVLQPTDQTAVLTMLLDVVLPDRKAQYPHSQNEISLAKLQKENDGLWPAGVSYAVPSKLKPAERALLFAALVPVASRKGQAVADQLYSNKRHFLKTGTLQNQPMSSRE